jgi:hypothetical protein
MKALLEAAVQTRTLIENDAVGLSATHRDALRRLVDFTLAACPPSGGEKPIATRQQHLVYMHPSNRRALFFEPHDPWTPYYEWVRACVDEVNLSGWKLVNRHAWRVDALLIVAGKAQPPSSSRPPPPSEKPSIPPVQIMPLEDQIRQVLAVAKDRGLFTGFLAEAVHVLQEEGFDLDSDNVKDALYRVTRGTPFHLEAPAVDLARRAS